jgi:hypothetical protein
MPRSEKRRPGGPPHRRHWRGIAIDVELPSRVEGASFQASLTGWWRWKGRLKHGAEEVDPAVLAALVRICESVSANRLVNQPLAAQALCNAALARRSALTDLGVEAFGSVRIAADQLDLIRTEEFLTSQRRTETIQPDLTALQEIFASDASAKLWWAMQFPNALAAISDGTIESIVRAVKSENEQRALGIGQEDSLISVLSEFLNRIDNAEQLPTLMDAFLRFLKFANHNDLANRVVELNSPEIPQTASKSEPQQGT